MRTARIIPAAILTTILLVLAIPVGAATRIWLGETALWSDPDSWSPNGVPQNGDFLSFPDISPVGETSMNNDLPNLTVNNMTFTAGGYSLNGQTLTFIQGITDNHSGSGLNRINCNVQFVNGGGVFATLNTGRLEINGTTTLAKNDYLNITAMQTNITVNGVIQGNGGLLKRGEGTLFLRGSSANTYTGPTRVEGGALHLAKTSAARAISPIVVIDGSNPGIPSLSDDLPGQYPPLLSMAMTNGGTWFITNGATVTNLTMSSYDVIGGSGLLTLQCDVRVFGGGQGNFFSDCDIFCPIFLGDQTRTFAVNDSRNGNIDLYIHRQIIGPGPGPNSPGIVKTGTGEMHLMAANIYFGPTIIERGLLFVSDEKALGGSGPGAETRIRGTLYFEAFSPMTVAESLVMEGGSIGFAGRVTVTGPMVITEVGRFYGPGSSQLELTGPISGPEAFDVFGGTVRLSGSAPNTFGGATSAVFVEPFDDFDYPVAALELAKPDNVVAVPVPVRLFGSGTNQAVLRNLQHNGVSDVSLSRGASWLLNGRIATPTAVTFLGDAFIDTQGGQLQLTSPSTNQLRAIARFSSDYTAWIFGSVGLVGPTNIILVDPGVTLDLFAQVDGPFPIQKEGNGTLRLSRRNIFSGPVAVNAGRLTAANAGALGTTTAGTFVNNDASLALEGGFEVVDEVLTLDSTNFGALISLGPKTNVWSGDIILQRTADIAVADPRGVLSHSGFGTFSTVISGPGGLTKSGPGTLTIGGVIGANRYTGPTTITEGLLEALRRSSFSDDILVTGTNATLRTGRATGLSPARTVLPVGARMTVQDGALWAMNGTNFETLSRLVGDGRLQVSTGGSLTVSNSVSCTFSGSVSGTGALNKLGLATFRVSGQSPSYTGPATVFDGTYKVDGYFAASPVTVKLSSVLRGSGAVGDVTVENGGVVRVDPSNPGLLGGAMQFNSANFHAGGVLAAGFFGPHPTAGNDFLYVLNGVTLSNSAHSFGFLYPPREGDAVTVIQKIASDAIRGAFSGLPEGALRTIGQIPVVASYVGGNGNDMTLTVTNLPLRSGGEQLLSGNAGSALVPNDCSQLWLTITNRGAVALTGLGGQLRSLTEGVLVTRAESAYPDLAPNARGSNAMPFQIRTEPTFPCGGGAQFELVLIGSNIPPIAVLYPLLGNAGRALAFNGSGNYVAVPHTTALNAFPFTVTMWVKTSQSSAGLVTKYVSSSLNGWSVFLRSGRVHAWYFRDSANNVWGGGDGLDGGFVADGQWHHIAFTVNTGLLGSGGRLYVDGVLKDTQAWSSGRDPQPGPPTTTQEVRLGNESGAGIPFDGLLDEITIWQAVLSQAQIQTNMHRGLTGAEANLLAYYRCDESSGFTVSDSAPLNGNNNGTWVGTPMFAPSAIAPFIAPGGPDCNSGGGACESCIVMSGEFSTNTNTLETIRRLTAAAGPSVCDPPKPCPGFDEFPDAPVRHAVHHFTNSTAAELCLTAQLRLSCPSLPNGAFGLAAYAGEFRINQPCSNYLGDDGAADSVPPPFSFRVPPQTKFLLVVTARTTNLLCDRYTLELFGLPCPPPRLDIAKDTNKVLLSWSTAYPDYRLQSAGSLNGPGPISFNNVTTPPVLLGGKLAVTNVADAPRRFFRLNQLRAESGE